MATKRSPGRAPRPYDVVVFGATGFTGRLVAEYLAARHVPGGLRLALAGRSRDRLARARGEIAARAPAAADLDLLVADSHDRASLDAMAAQTSVVCTTVGPYLQHGAELVAACVAAGTDACDLTGETPFIRQMIDRHHAEAVAAGARIVCCCGFDSVPSDLGTLLLQETARERHGAPCDRVTFYLAGARGGFSGGTVASLLGVLDQVRDPAVRKVLGNPYALNPEGERKGPDGRDQAGLRFDAEARAWTAPFVMAAINTRVVRRSHALLGYPWGRGFRYAEVSRLAPGPLGFARAAALTAGLGGFVAAASVGPVRRLLERRLLPAPGEGPSAEAREAGFFKVELVGRYDGDAHPPVKVVVRGDRDPGYGATAAMLGESAVCLALDPPRAAFPGGVLTPATAMGLPLVDRLNRSHVTFDAP